ncbi:dipeptidase [Sunxiuqinia sp. A32]|uniref:dipeptidase n=1 Tax=Sunxiuqinia sp. A32 TaxID=3461496 RepID=UPI00404665DD
MNKLLLLPILVFFSFVANSQENDDRIWKMVHKIHQNSLTIDTHNDTPYQLLKPGFNISERHEAPNSRVDFPRMVEGGLDAMFMGVFTGQKPRTQENYKQAYNKANQMLDSIHSMLEQFPDQAELAIYANDAERIAKKGKRAIYIGMENGFPIGKNIERVEEFYNRGVRYVTLCHSFHNDICDSSSDAEEPEHHGVSDFGKEVIVEMNRLGMMIDVSHMSDQSFFDVMQYSKAPVIASHSSSRAVCKHDRNMSDEMIKALAAKGGVIQLCILDNYIKEPDTTTARYEEERKLHQIYRTTYKNMNEDEKEAFNKRWDEVQKLPKKMPTVSDAVDHIDHIVQLVGVDYVGIGSDFDGGGGIADCEDVSKFPNITYELFKRGYSAEDIHKIWGRNLLRVMKQVEEVSNSISKI